MLGSYSKLPAYLEWARTDTAVPECPSDLCTTPLTDPGLYLDKFKLVWYPGMSCSTGNYCGDGLCQACNTPTHCGPSCITCPAAFNLCSAGRCVQCVADDQCPPWQICDIPNGKCAIAPPGNRNDQCTMPWRCALTTHRCQNPPIPCVTTPDCPMGLMCTDGL